MIVGRRQAGLVVTTIGCLLFLANALGVAYAVADARWMELVNSSLVLVVAGVMAVASYRFSSGGVSVRLMWLCLGLLAVDTAAGIITGPARAAGVVILAILAVCFLLSLGHEGR
jgi:hypothetical protein